MISPNSGPQGSRQGRLAPRSALFAGMVRALVATGAGAARQIQMRLHRSRRFLLALALFAVAAPQAASAVVIEFDGIVTDSDGLFTGPVTEDGFDYDLLTGTPGLFGTFFFGNPGPSMEGSTKKGGGTLRIRRSDGGLFTFDAADISNWSAYGTALPQDIAFVGLLAGVELDTDFLSTLGDTWVTRVSFDLAGVLIDELRVVLDAALETLPAQEWAETVDNIVLTVVDAPTPIVLLGLGMVLMGYQRRGRAAKGVRAVGGWLSWRKPRSAR